MATSLSQNLVSSKIDILTQHINYLDEQRDYLKKLVDDASEVLQLANSWLRNPDETKVTFKDINKMVEDKLVLLNDKCSDISPFAQSDHEKTTMQQEFATTRLVPAVSQSTDQPLPPGCERVSSITAVPDELKIIMSQVEMIQETMTLFIRSTKEISEKQLTMEQCIENLSVKYTNLEQEKMRVLEIELTSISDKHKKLASQKDIGMKSFENKIKAVTDAQLEIKENQQQQQKIIMKEQKKEHEKLQKQSQQFTQDLNVCMENIQELNSRICHLEKQTHDSTQLEALGDRVAFLEEDSACLVGKFEEHVPSFEEFTQKTEDILTKLSSVQGKDFERLQEFKEKISRLEMSWNDYSQETETLYKDVETKYQMVCQVIADRLAPLERLRDIFNEKLDVRNENMKKLDTVCDKMVELLSKFSQLEMETQRQAIGFSARGTFSSTISKAVTDYATTICNIGSHFDNKTGVFTAPLDGMYATCVSVVTGRNENLVLSVLKEPCKHNRSLNTYCEQCKYVNIVTQKGEKRAFVFVLIDMKAGDTLYVIGSSDGFIGWVGFTCFRIG